MDAPYQRIAADLRRRIRSGTWAPGQLLPSWRDLQARYAVGQGAIRLAVRQLRSEGLVEGSQRARLWVAYPPAVRTLVNPDADWPYGRGDGESGTCRASEDLRRRLQTPLRAKLYWERRELLDPGGRPAMVVTTWQRGPRWHTHVSVRCEVRPHALTADEAVLLGLARDTMAFLVERTRYDIDGRPVQAADLVLPADRWRVGWLTDSQ
ncbi:GntR family transcriptional regulator [Streptomyces sp. NPDC054933]